MNENVSNESVTSEALVARDGELHIRQISAEIANIYDDLLASNDIMVPDEDREGNEDEAALYGSTYSEFEDGITEQLANIVTGVRSSGADTAAAKGTIYESFEALLRKHGITVPGSKDEVFLEMDKEIAKLLSIVAKYPQYPVNNWEY
jgi:hypothetical protein